MFLKDRLATIKLKEGDSLTQDIQTFHASIGQLMSLWIIKSDKDTKLSLMRNMPSSYRTFLTAFRENHNLTLQKLITYLIQEETIMKFTD